MRKRIKAYLEFIDMILEGKLPVNATFDVNGKHNTIVKKDVAPTRKEYETLLERHKEQIAFFSHERLVHLLVTILFAIATFAVFFVNLFMFNTGLLILLGLLVILLVPYIMHYYLLENGVQKMYVQYDEIVKKMK